MRKISLLFIGLLIFTSNLFSQDVWVEKVYIPTIKTVKLEVKGADFSMPMLRLGSSDKLILKFDDLTEETKQYNYTIIHCNSDWTQSELQTQEYIQGFESGYIENHNNSINTVQRYVHYWQEFPSSMMKFLVSGNYIIKIYENDDPQKVIMVRRFMVYEDEALVRAVPMMARSPQDQRSKQEIDVYVSPKSNMSFADPSRFIKVFVQQNGRRDNFSLLKLHQYKSNELEYSYDNSNIFEAGNEFRSFDFTRLRVRSQYVNNFDFIEDENYVKLKPSDDRSRLTYSTVGDINGYYYIRNDRGENYDLESDYAWVNFYLPIPMRLGVNFYIWGELSDWYCNEQNKMEFNQRLNSYTASLYLKQGFYNYMIMSKPVTQNPFYSLDAIEGNHSETNNTYHIFVYYRKPGNFYDSLIGYSKADVN